MNSETFWMVWCDCGNAPTYKHPSEKSAQDEAARLARLKPGIRFVVLQAIEAVQVCDIQRTKLSAVPF